MKSKGCLTVTHWEKDNDLPMRRQIWRDSRYEGDDVKSLMLIVTVNTPYSDQI